MYKKFNPKYGRGAGDGDSRSIEMHDAVCADCGKNCKVPFRPTGNKPVFCRECFQEQSGGDFERPRERKQSFDATCDTCGSECTVPFKPIKGRPLYCPKCMGKGDSDFAPKNRYEAPASRSASNYQAPAYQAPVSHAAPAGISKAQYDVLNGKLDKILKLLDLVNEAAGDLDEDLEEDDTFEEVEEIAVPKVAKKVEVFEAAEDEEPVKAFFAAKKAGKEKPTVAKPAVEKKPTIKEKPAKKLTRAQVKRAERTGRA